MANQRPQSSASQITRRTALKAGAAGTAIGLAGCIGGGGGGGTDSITVGGLAPVSGAFSEIGPNFRQAIELAVQHANEQYESDIELLFSDTQSDAGEGSTAAQEMISDGADFIVGSYSSATAGALASVAERQNVIFAGIAGDNAITGEDCQPNTFISSPSATMQLYGGLGYAVDNDLGDSVYEISVDYSWGQSLQRWAEDQLIPETDLEYLGNTFADFGQEDLSGPINTAMNSGADIINLNMAPITPIATQAAEFGMYDEHVVTFSNMDRPSGQAIGQDIISHENFYGSSPYYWELDTPENNNFVEAYRDEFDETPISYSPFEYINVLTVIDAIVQEDSTAPDDLRPVLEDGDFVPQIWNAGERYRACDHRGTVGVITLQGKDPSEVEEEDDVFEVLRQVEDAEATMRPCDQTGCEL